MKLIHELYTPAQCGGCSLRPYALKLGDKALPVSGYIDELMIIAPENHPHDKEVIIIEGDLAVVHDALNQCLEALNAIATDAVQRGELDPEWYQKSMAKIKALRNQRKTLCK